MTGAVFHTCLVAEGGEEEPEPEFSLITGGFVPTKETNQLEDGVFIIMIVIITKAVHFST